MNLGLRQTILISNNTFLHLPIFWFDGINNAGKDLPHINSSNTWVNLGTAGSDFNAIRNTDSTSTLTLWNENSAVFTSKSNARLAFLVGNERKDALTMLGDTYTIGATFMANTGWNSNYSGLLGSHADWNDGINVGFVFLQYEGGKIRNGTIYKANDMPGAFYGWQPNSSIITIGYVHNLIISISPKQRSLYLDGNIIYSDTTQCDSYKLIITGNYFTIGCSALEYVGQTSTDRTFVGNIYDVYAWNKLFTDKEIRNIANYSLNKLII